MKNSIIQDRLATHGFTGPDFTSARDVVSYYGAVQSQDYAGAMWSLAHRIPGTTIGVLEREYDDGKILRTHVMRPTWHFVVPENLNWMQELTAGRVKALMNHYNRKLELDDVLFKKSNGIIRNSLKNHSYKTRQEIKTILAREGIKTDVQRLGHIVSRAELDGLIASGPRRGKQFTYALVSDRAPGQIRLTRDEALAKLADLYFQSHGPAQLKDFSWWSGLTQKEAHSGLAMIQSRLEPDVRDGKTYWFRRSRKHAPAGRPSAYLVSIYDEYVIGYTDRSDIGNPEDGRRMLAMGNAMTAVMISGGRITGSWRKIVRRGKAEITLRPFRAVTAGEKKLFEREARAYGKFFGTPVAVETGTPVRL